MAPYAVALLQAQKVLKKQKLEAELVSIDGNYWISDSLQGEHWGNAVQIQQKDESLEISALVKG